VNDTTSHVHVLVVCCCFISSIGDYTSHFFGLLIC